MKAARVLDLIILVAASEIASGSELGNRIFGGTMVEPGEMPFMAAIFDENQGGSDVPCGGSIINERHILTAAHCLSGLRMSPESIKVQVGCVDLLRCESEKLQVAKIVIHPNYEVVSKDELPINDVAIIKLKDALTFNGKTIDAIDLAADKELCCDEAQKKLAVAGWGLTENGSGSSDLLKVGVYSIPLGVCKTFEMGLYVDHSMICAGNPGRDSCYGDSGGPLFEVDTFGTQTQVGIVSHGLDPSKPCGSKRGGAYTKVAFFRDWIDDHIY